MTYLSNKKHTVAVVNNQQDFVAYKLVEIASAVLATAELEQLEKQVETVEIVVENVEKSFENVQNMEVLVDMAVVVVAVADIEDNAGKMISNL